jgi:hypothetical protein
MRAALPFLALSLATGAAAETAVPAPAPGITIPMPAPNSPLVTPEGRVPCRDTVHAVREERGLPQLRRETAAPDEPLLIAAVDQRINGCAVMVMYDNTNDVRPLPALPQGSGHLQRIPGE